MEARLALTSAIGAAPTKPSPPVWMVYFTVSDLSARLAAANRRGAQVLVAPKPGSNPFAIIKDPAGAVCALYEVKTPGDKE